jgi:hypothetical protein
VSDKPLFGSWLGETKTLQEQYYDKEYPISGQALTDYIVINTVAAEDELHEALNEVSWKPWASAEFMNREAFIGELVDCLHFIGNMLVGVDFTDEEFTKAYSEKMIRNRDRMTHGYTGLEKCRSCKRSKDDVIAHGGRFLTDDTDFTMLCGECHAKGF